MFLDSTGDRSALGVGPNSTNKAYNKSKGPIIIKLSKERSNICIEISDTGID